jgi:hypothetical protein
MAVNMRGTVQVAAPGARSAENQNAFPGDPERRGESRFLPVYADDSSTATTVMASAGWQIHMDGRNARFMVLPEC